MSFYRTKDTSAGLAVIFILLWLAAAGGWIANLVKIFVSAGDPITGFFIVRCIGVIAAPVGVVLGYL